MLTRLGQELGHNGTMSGSRSLSHCLVVVLLASLVSLLAPLGTTSATAADPCSSASLPPGDYTEKNWPMVQHKPDGTAVPRSFRAHVPATHAKTPMPVVFDLHGAFSGKDEQDKRTALRDKGDQAGFIVIQPDSWPHWTTSPKDETSRGISDIAFARALLDTVTAKLCVDPSRIYSVGFSSGGLMSSILACAAAQGKLGGHRIAAIGLVAAAPVPAEVTGPVCPALARQPVPMRLIFSSNDHTLAGLCCGGDTATMAAGVRTVAATWGRENGCDDASTIKRSGRTGWGVLTETVTHTCARPNSQVTVDIFDTGSPLLNGHIWPGRAYGGEYPTTEVLWNFLSQYRAGS